MGIWIALEDADRDNGCLWMAPGARRGPLRERYAVDWVDIDEPERGHHEPGDSAGTLMQGLLLFQGLSFRRYRDTGTVRGGSL